MKLLLRSHDAAYVNSCMEERHLHAKLHQKTVSRIEVALQLVMRAKTALSKSVGKRSFGIAQFFYIVHEKKTVLLPVVVSLSDGFSPFS